MHLFFSSINRRWKYLHPDEVHVLQARRKMQKAALMSNFVDRERERPALGPNDFMPLALTNPASEHGDVIASQKHERKSRYKFQNFICSIVVLHALYFIGFHLP